MVGKRSRSAEKQISEFVAMYGHPSRIFGKNQWLEEDASLKLYVRISTRWLDGRMVQMLDLATIDAAPTGQGRFTRFLETIEPWKPVSGIFIENVVNERFRGFFRERGYAQYGEDILPSFYKLWG